MQQLACVKRWRQICVQRNEHVVAGTQACICDLCSQHRNLVGLDTTDVQTTGITGTGSVAVSYLSRSTPCTTERQGLAALPVQRCTIHKCALHTVRLIAIPVFTEYNRSGPVYSIITVILSCYHDATCIVQQQAPHTVESQRCLNH